MSNIGMMDGAFFVGRKELVDWVNETLEINISKIEQTASGAIACQLFDIMHPGCVPMSKINWGAKQDFEFVANYKILQTAFNKHHVDKHVDVDRLIKGKYQDNLEFMQWFKRFYEMTVQDKGDYDCAAVRCRGKGGDQFNTSMSRVGGGSSTGASSRPARPRVLPSTSRPGSSSATSRTTAKSTVAPAPAAAAKREANSVAPKKEANTASAAEIAELKSSNDKLTLEFSDLKMEGLEKERNFYFDKLRDIEMMLQDQEDSGNGNEVTKSIFKILYATAEGFDRVDDVVVAEEEDIDVGPPEAEEVIDDVEVEDAPVMDEGEEDETY